VAKLQPARGTRDIWGDEARRMEQVIRSFIAVAERFCYSKISTPVFEFSEVFKRTLGEASDVVSKEMYSFEDRGGEEITLRPEYTAGIARAYISEGMQQFGVSKLYGYGPMFRYERPQKGRYRQFHQLDVEVIGAAGPGADIETIALGQQLLEELGFAGKVELHMNSLGDMESRRAYRSALVEYFSDHKGKLSDDSKARLEKNPLRILDSKDRGDRTLLGDAPKLSGYMNAESGDFFGAVKAGLDVLNIVYVQDDHLVRGLDYYCHTAFEFITDALGAQGTVIGGGRYDGLIEQLGGPPTPGVGWAAGIERLAMLLDETPAPARPIAMVPLGGEAEARALVIAHDLRLRGLAVDTAFRGNITKRLQRANRINARAAVILGDDELAKGVATLRDLDSGEQREVALDKLVNELAAEN
jgi:histidyl-tRNA synthetase